MNCVTGHGGGQDANSENFCMVILHYTPPVLNIRPS